MPISLKACDLVSQLLILLTPRRRGCEVPKIPSSSNSRRSKSGFWSPMIDGQ